MTSSQAPLSGIHVLDFTANMSGPMATMVLGDQGADVIKVESPDGDIIRHIGTRSGDVSTYFANLNRSKRSLCMDLTAPSSEDARQALFQWADVVVHNVRPEAARRAGIDAETVLASHPTLVHATIVGIGSHGQAAGLPVYDHVVQALSGMAAQQAGSDGQPQLIRHGMIDKTTGLVVAQAVTAALLRRVRTGTGCAVSVSMLDVALSVLWPDAMTAHTALGDVERRPSIASSFKLTPTADGHVAMAVATARQWAGLARVVGVQLADGDDVADLGAWLRVGTEVLGRFKAWAAGAATDAVVTQLWRAAVPSAPVVGLDMLPEEPIIVANETLEVVDHPVLGPIRQPRPPVSFDGDRPHLSELLPAPHKGEHSEDILRRFGLTGTVDDMQPART